MIEYNESNVTKFKNKINLSGITPEALSGVFILLLALVNAVLAMFGIKTLPIENDEIATIVSGIFLVGAALWNTWKNRNVTTVAQVVQQIADALKQGEIVEKDIREILDKVKK